MSGGTTPYDAPQAVPPEPDGASGHATDHAAFGTAAARAAREVHAPTDVAGTLSTIVEVAVRSLPEVDHASVTVARSSGEVETRAASDALARELDHLQYELGEGPCLYAALAEETVLVEHVRHDQRWPRFLGEAVRRGVRAQVALRLSVDGSTFGALNLFSTTADAFSDETRDLAELFATNAALALGGVRQREHLTAAVESRQLIGAAIGIVMERFGLDEEHAFAYLARLSQTTNRKLRDVAGELVRGTSGT